MSMIEDGTPGGRLVLTAEQYALLDAPEVRRKVIQYVPLAVMLITPAQTEDGLFVYDDHRLRGDDVDTILYLLDNPSVLDAIAAEWPAEETP